MSLFRPFNEMMRKLDFFSMENLSKLLHIRVLNYKIRRELLIELTYRYIYIYISRLCSIFDAMIFSLSLFLINKKGKTHKR